MQLSAEHGDGRVECNLHPRAAKIDGKFSLFLLELVEIIIDKKIQIWAKHSSRYEGGKRIINNIEIRGNLSSLN